MVTRRPAISDAALVAAWQAVPPAERHAFICEALDEDASYQLLRALSDRQPAAPAPLPAADELQAMWERESSENLEAARASVGRPRLESDDPDVEHKRARRREAARRQRERQKAGQAAVR